MDDVHLLPVSTTAVSAFHDKACLWSGGQLEGGFANDGTVKLWFLATFVMQFC